MTPPRSDRAAAVRAGAWLLRLALVAVAIVAVDRRNLPLFANAVGPLAVSLLAARVSLPGRDEPALGPLLVFWVTLAGLIHAAGALEFYRAFDWYDSLAHAVSGGFVAAVGYATLRAVERAREGVTLRPAARLAVVVVVVMAAGVGWEIAEFASTGLTTRLERRPVLVQRGPDDVVSDLLFNVVGVAFLAVVPTRGLDRLVRSVAATLRDRE